MRRILVCTGVLGGGTALVFALAAATALMFPQGTVVSAGWNSDMRMMGGGVFLGGVQKVGGPVLVAPAQTVTITSDGVKVVTDGAPVPVPQAAP
jgi:hypothetical protein